MIFVTVGTHEQSFKRLIEKIDKLVEKGVIKDNVFMQIGYTNDYIPKNCEYKELITSDEMDKYCEEADIIITHGGPGSIMLPFRLGKVPVVVPRNPKFNEHVDEHQMLFTKKLQSFEKVIGIFDIDDIEDVLVNYNQHASKCKVDSNNTLKNFVTAFEKEVLELVD
jgi:UDP-N-acetylglucosamine transferase subunit ALG13